MAKVKSEELAVLRTWWVQGLLAIVFLGLAYGFLSLAIDSGSWLEYGVGIGFFVWAISCLIRAVKIR